MIIKINEFKLFLESLSNIDKLKNKYSNIDYNKDNYSIGGGLSGGMSNRNMNAKYDSGKLTVPQFITKFVTAYKKDKNIDLDKKIINTILKSKFNFEWHHAGFLPKSYGGGMKKIYYINSEEIIKFLNNFEEYLNEFNNQKQEIISKENLLKDLINKNILIKFTREKILPEYSIKVEEEMNGKYGWFPATSKYKMDIYYSGYKFNNKDNYDKYSLVL